MIPSIEPSEVGTTGLIWLLASYGYVLFQASNLISEGSELLLLVPSLAGLVGGVVLPLLGAVPDGAIMLFSGLGDINKAQETLSVGVGALAGSTIMLLTVPWGLSVLAGQVDLVPGTDGEKVANYLGKEKLSPGRSAKDVGVVITDEVKHGSYVMMLTTIPYFLIQIPASFLEGQGKDDKGIAQGEKYWALLALLVCLTCFVWYLSIHIKASRDDEQKFRRMEVMKDLLKNGQVSLAGAFQDIIKAYDEPSMPLQSSGQGYQAIGADLTSPTDDVPSPKVLEYLHGVLKPSFKKYDKDNSEGLEKNEVRVFLRDFNEKISEEELDLLFSKYDKDDNGNISFHEFVLACYSIIVSASKGKSITGVKRTDLKAAEQGFATAAVMTVTEEEEEEEEEVPEDIANLSPDKQEAAVKKKAFTMLAIGTFLVVLFSDPMVDVMKEVAVRVKVNPFYVSFILAPLASNASEVLASTYYASKKTSKTITVSFSALQGAAAMNNTFCLSIFMGLIFFRGLAWEFTSETIAIFLIQFVIYYMTLGDTMSSFEGLVILAIFPLSIVFVASLKAAGLD